MDQIGTRFSLSVSEEDLSALEKFRSVLTKKIIPMMFECFRSCEICGRFWGRIDLYCDSCWTSILNSENLNQNTKAKSSYDFFVSSLLSWPKDRETEVTRLIKDLKGGRLESANLRLAEKLLLEIDFEEFIGETIIVPAPTKRERSEDHGLSWAQAISKLTGFELVEALQKEQARSQKKLRIDDREKISIDLRPGFSPEDFGNCRVILADDVITSGSTARASWQALGMPSDFEAWTIADRPKLAAK